MKLLKNIFLIFWLFILCFFLISCDGNSSSQDQDQIQQFENIYFNYPLRDYPIGKSEGSQLYWDCSENDFGHYLPIYRGYHSGEDWQLKGTEDNEVDNGKPVYSIGKGKVAYVSDGPLCNLGYLVVIEHTGNFLIPSKEISDHGQIATYEEEIVNKIYSVYLHINLAKIDGKEILEGDIVDENTPIGFIMNPPRMGSHLHFEIRKDLDNHSDNWSMLGNEEYWQFDWVADKNDPSKRVKDYNGYYINLQEMVNAGFRDPSDFIEANREGVKTLVSSAATEMPGQSSSIETEIAKDNFSEYEERIAFRSDRDGDFDIYTMNFDGTNQTNLTNNFNYEEAINYSPIINKIVFTSYMEEDHDICVINTDGTGFNNILNNDSDEIGPIFSPDGTKIIFHSDYNSIDDIYIINADGSDFKQITKDDFYEGSLRWSPDGSKIAFTSNRDGNYEIYIVNQDGSGLVRLTNDGANDWSPTWSPDGSKIAFTSNRDGNYEIYIINYDGSGLVRLTNNYADDTDPDWSPDSSKIIFLSDRKDTFCEDIFSMNIDGTEQINLTNTDDIREMEFSISNDGTKIAFDSFPEGIGDICIMNFDGSNQIRLTENPAFEDSPIFIK